MQIYNIADGAYSAAFYGFTDKADPQMELKDLIRRKEEGIAARSEGETKFRQWLETAEQPTTRSGWAGSCGEWRVPFGKYHDHTYAAVAIAEPTYLKWLMNIWKGSPIVKEYMEFLLEGFWIKSIQV